MHATHVTETYVNETEGYSYGEDTYPIAGTVFEDMTPGDAYRWLVREYGRCTGRVYIDSPGGPVHCGWAFERRERYEDTRTNETYLRAVWVTFARETSPARPATLETVAVSGVTP